MNPFILQWILSFWHYRVLFFAIRDATTACHVRCCMNVWMYDCMYTCMYDSYECTHECAPYVVCPLSVYECMNVVPVVCMCTNEKHWHMTHTHMQSLRRMRSPRCCLIIDQSLPVPIDLKCDSCRWRISHPSVSVGLTWFCLLCVPDGIGTFARTSVPGSMRHIIFAVPFVAAVVS